MTRRKLFALPLIPLTPRALGSNEVRDWEFAFVGEDRSKGLTKDEAYRLFEANKAYVWTNNRIEIRHNGQVVRVQRGRIL